MLGNTSALEEEIEEMRGALVVVIGMLRAQVDQKKHWERLSGLLHEKVAHLEDMLELLKDRIKLLEDKIRLLEDRIKLLEDLRVKQDDLIQALRSPEASVEEPAALRILIAELKMNEARKEAVIANLEQQKTQQNVRIRRLRGLLAVRRTLNGKRRRRSSLSSKKDTDAGAKRARCSHDA